VSGRGARDRLAAALASFARLFPAILILAIWTGSVFRYGSYFPVHWYVWALATVAVLAIVIAASGRVLPASRHAQIALGAFAVWVAWNYLSILWADAPGAAWDAANKLAMYLAGAWTLALLEWRSRSAMGMVGAWSLIMAAVAAGSLSSALSASDLTDFFIDGRYAEPFGYPNGVAAAAALGMLPALALSARREVPVVLQAAFLGVAVFLLEVTLLPQSRGAFIGLAAGVAVLVLLSPDRLKLVPRIAVLGVALGLTASKIVDISEATTRTRVISPVLDEAVRAMLLTVAVAIAIGLVLSLIERRVRVGERARKRIGVAIAVGATLVALAGLAVSAAKLSSTASEAWDNFRTSTSDDSGAHVLSTGDPQRYDYWSAAYHLFLENPASGVGAGNFAHHYAARRDFEKHSRYAHDIGFRIISENGIPGALAFLTMLAAIGAGALSARRRADPAARAAIATTTAMLAYFLGHASFDWLDEFPALAGPALALPFVGLALLPAAGGRSALRVRTRRLTAAGIAVLLAGVLASLTIPYMSHRYVARAQAAADENPAAANRDFQRARDINPLTVEPDLSRGTLAVKRGRWREGSAAFTAALEREPNWYAHFELALLAAREGRFREAKARLHTARRLNVADPALYELARRIRHRRKVDPRRFNKLVLDVSLFKRDRLR
jgi:tetratricopeptide (TPR) repeat protein